MSKMPVYKAGDQIATRNAGADCIQPIAQALPFYNSGSADLHGSNKNYIKDVGDFSKSNYAGRNFYYGMGFYGTFRVSGSTFLVFSDYMRASVRVAALSHIPVNYIWTHDSIGVGEDGPTHQPVEVVASLRNIPNLDVYRPGDADETAAAYVSAMQRTTGPTALILSRQNLPVQPVDVKTKHEGALKGGYTLIKETAALERIIVAAGSEVWVAVDAARGGLRAPVGGVPRGGAAEGDEAADHGLRGGRHRRLVQVCRQGARRRRLRGVRARRPGVRGQGDHPG